MSNAVKKAEMQNAIRHYHSLVADYHACVTPNEVANWVRIAENVIDRTVTEILTDRMFTSAAKALKLDLNAAYTRLAHQITIANCKLNPVPRTLAIVGEV